jgi:hypothetical protein
VKVADPKRAPAAERVCRCAEPLLQLRASGKWATDRYCERCGRLAPITLRR